MGKKHKRLLITISGVVMLLAGIIGVYHWTNQPAPRSTPPVAESRQNARPPFDKTRYSTTDPTSPWVIVNKQHPLNPVDYAPTDLTGVGNNQVMRAEAAAKLGEMFTAAAKAGNTLIAASAYRSYQTQVRVYNAEVSNFGQGQADSESARPGYSEHQTGWAVDIGGGGCNIDDCFANTAEGKWTAANAYKYGFILRYTPADTNITGYRFESWHYRYVGVYLSTYMHDNNVATLEQLFNVSGGPEYKN